MFERLKSLEKGQIFGIAVDSMKAAILFFVVIFAFVLPLSIAFDWIEDKPIASYFTLDFAFGLIRQPLFYFAIVQMFVIFFVGSIYSAIKKINDVD